MITNIFNIQNIPGILWGDNSNNLFVAVHGNMSNKSDDVVTLFAEQAVKLGYQVLSFDLPEHGERKNEGIPCKVQYCVEDLITIMDYAKQNWKNISLFACSMGAYFSLLAYKNDLLKQSLFLSPVVDMKRIINNMMTWFDVSEEQLKKENEIATPVGQNLYWDYYCYVKEHPVDKWDKLTAILYGAKDNLCEFNVVSRFAEKFDCSIKIMEQGEHYFHTEEQLEFFEQWLKSKIHRLE